MQYKIWPLFKPPRIGDVLAWHSMAQALIIFRPGQSHQWQLALAWPKYTKCKVYCILVYHQWVNIMTYRKICLCMLTKWYRFVYENVKVYLDLQTNFVFSLRRHLPGPVWSKALIDVGCFTITSTPWVHNRLVVNIYGNADGNTICIDLPPSQQFCISFWLIIWFQFISSNNWCIGLCVLDSSCLSSADLSLPNISLTCGIMLLSSWWGRRGRNERQRQVEKFGCLQGLS